MKFSGEKYIKMFPELPDVFGGSHCMTKIVSKDEQLEKNYYTQTELSERWKVSPGTIINWRKEGRLPFFKLPGASKILYPVDLILECEQKHTTLTKEEQKVQIQLTESKRKKPVVSAKPRKEWRI